MAHNEDYLDDSTQSESPSMASVHASRPFRPRPMLRCFLAVLLCAEAWTLGMPVYIDSVLFVAVIVIAWRATTARVLTLALAGIVGIALMELCVRYVIDPTNTYGEQPGSVERFAAGGRFIPNLDTSLDMPCGELPLLDPLLSLSVCEPRTIRFKTDSAGLRNDSEYVDGELVLIGDSFVAGIGSDQCDTLSNVLRNDHGVAAYGIGIPSAPSGYFRFSEQFLQSRNSRASFVMCVFEGNDFESPGSAYVSPNKYDRTKLRFARLVHGIFRTTRYLIILTRNLERRVLAGGNRPVHVYRVGGRDMGFLKAYIDGAISPTLPLRAVPESSPVYARLRVVLFIPTRYRVYSDLINTPHPLPPDPPPGLISLQRHFARFSVPVLDLTPALKTRARELLARDTYVYWRDDTHWNKHGVRVAAAELAAFLAGHPTSSSSTKSSSK